MLHSVNNIEESLPNLRLVLVDTFRHRKKDNNVALSTILVILHLYFLQPGIQQLTIAGLFLHLGMNLSPVIGRAKRAPHWGVQSRFRVIYIYIYIYVCLSYVKSRGIT